jgi:hypothetical protein
MTFRKKLIHKAHRRNKGNIPAVVVIIPVIIDHRRSRLFCENLTARLGMCRGDQKGTSYPPPWNAHVFLLGIMQMQTVLPGLSPQTASANETDIDRGRGFVSRCRNCNWPCLYRCHVTIEGEPVKVSMVEQMVVIPS